MKPIKDAWIKSTRQHGLTIEETERVMRYMEDLISGRDKLQRLSQGVSIFGSARSKENDQFYEQARELGRRLAENGEVVITGGGGGIMEAGNRGAFEAGGVSVGLNIHLPMEQNLNRWTTDSVEFNYFFARKVMLVDVAKVYVYFPGGFGTLDELAEVLTLIQTNKITKAPVYLFGSQYWSKFDTLVKETMLETGYIFPEDTGLYKITDNIDEIVEAAKQTEGRRIGDIVDAENMLHLG